MFLLTDGGVNAPNSVIELVKANSENFTLHTFGIGDGVSTELIIECARAGKGKHYFVVNNCGDLQTNFVDAISTSLKRKIYVTRSGITTNWEVLYEYPQLDSIPSEMYPGDFFYYFMIGNDVEGDELEGSLKMYMTEDQTQKPKKKFFDLSRDGKRIEGDCLFKMFWKTYIKDLQKDSNNEKLVTELALKYQIPCRYTYFIGVLKDWVPSPEEEVQESNETQSESTNNIYDSENEDEDQFVENQDVESEEEEIPVGSNVTIVKIKNNKEIFEVAVDPNITVGALKVQIQK